MSSRGTQWPRFIAGGLLAGVGINKEQHKTCHWLLYTGNALINSKDV